MQKIGNNYYLLISLPGMGDLGSAPPVSPADLFEHVEDSPGPRALLEALFLGDDLLQRQAFLAGEVEDLDLIVLTEEQGRDEEPLPGFLTEKSSDQEPLQIELDSLWQNYYRYMEQVARQYDCGFLAGWVGYEVAMRNALVAARAKALNLDPHEYIVAADLADTDEDFTSLISQWSGAPDPLAGLKVLDKARWEWLGEHDAWFSFLNDELAVYGAKLILLRRWQRLSEKQPVASNAASDN